MHLMKIAALCARAGRLFFPSVFPHLRNASDEMWETVWENNGQSVGRPEGRGCGFDVEIDGLSWFVWDFRCAAAGGLCAKD